MKKNKTKVSPTESYLLKRVKELEKENKALNETVEKDKGYFKQNQECYKGLQERYETLKALARELAQHFEIRSDESDKFDFSYFNGSYLHVINKSGDIEKCDKALIDFLNYVKENL